MALWKGTNIEKRQVLYAFGDGINIGVPPFDIKDTQVTYINNMGSQDYPAISTRLGRKLFSTSMTKLDSPNSISERNNDQFHVLDGNAWKYWDSASTSFVTLSTGLTSTDGDIQDFATGTDRYTIMMNSTQKFIWNGSTSPSVLGDANTPFTKIFTIHKGRIYAARDNDIMYSALNLPNDWTTINDSGSIDLTRGRGKITGLCEYNDHVIAFTEYSMHELYGDDPTNFTLVDVEGEIGCISQRSIVKCNKKLYWAWNDGIYEYNGASPIRISRDVDRYFDKIEYSDRTKIVSGSDSRYLYIYIPYNSTILVYDTQNTDKYGLGKWYVETGSITDFVTLQGKLYSVDTNGYINNIKSTELNDNGNEIQWELITKPFNDNGISQKKTLSDLWLVYKGSSNSTLNISYSTSVNSTTFTSLASSTDFILNDEEENSRIQIPLSELQNVDWYRLRFNGTGAVTLHYLEKNFRLKRR